MAKYSVLGVSAGNGVMVHPFKDNLIGNVEIRRDYLISKRPLQWDLNFNVPFLNFLPPYSPREVDVIIGHPKCGNSSIFALSRGKKFSTSSEEPSLTLFLDSVKKLQPRVWAMENLSKLLEVLSIDQLSELFLHRYSIKVFEGSVSNFGNSQITRKRLLIVGLDKLYFCPEAIEAFQFPKGVPSSFLKTSDLLIENLPYNGNITEPLEEVITLYAGFKIRLSELQDFWISNPHLKHYPILNGRMNTAPGVYINREGEFPMTVRKTNRQFNHHGIQMSPRELARIQGIPDSFRIFHDFNEASEKTLINKGRLTVANTPPYEVGEWLKDELDQLF